VIVASDMLLAVSGLALLLGLSGTAFQLAQLPILERPKLGIRGVKRMAALEAGGSFAAVEPLARIVGAWFQYLPLGLVRHIVRLGLTRAGECLGLSDDELFALSALAAVSGGAASALACAWFGWPSILVPITLSMGAILPWLSVRAIGTERARSVNRALPAVLELAAMCMSAGLDFPGSLRRVVGSAPDSREPIVEELLQVLQELELGHTRRSALERFAARVPTAQVRELASAIVQAEQKGSPLGPVLSIQAQTQRLRRSIAAEQIASDAALMLMGPMTLIFLCVIVLLLGPVAVRLMTGGLGLQ
jgi:tight adherence protein C